MNDCVADVEVGVMLNLYDSASTVISYFLGNLMFCMINIHMYPVQSISENMGTSKICITMCSILPYLTYQGC